MKRYNHVNELASELNAAGFIKDRDISIPADSDPEAGCLTDKEGNQLHSFPAYKSYYILWNNQK